MSKKTTVTALGAALLAGVTLATAVVPAASAATSTSSPAGGARATASIQSHLIGKSTAGYVGHFITDDGAIGGRYYPTIAQAVANSAVFSVPAPGRSGTITSGGNCLNYSKLPALVTFMPCNGTPSQTWSSKIDGAGAGVQYFTSDERPLREWNWDDQQWLGASETNEALDFVTFAVESAKVDPSSLSAVVSGTGVPGQVLVLNDDTQVTVDADSTWSATVTDLKFGINRVKVEAWDGGNLLGTQYGDASINVTPLTAVATFSKDVTSDATVSGTAEPGSIIVIRDASGKELARVSANPTTGHYSVSIGAPNRPGSTTLSAVQIIGGEETAPTAFDVDYGEALDVVTPISDLVVSNGSVTFTGTGTADAQVTVREKGAQGILGNTVILGNGRWQIPAIAADRHEHTYVVTQTAPGNNVTSHEVTINPGVSNVVAPTATMTFSSDVTQQATIGGAGTTGATMTVSSGGTQIGTPVTVANGSWSMPVPSSIGTGSHTFTVTQTIAGKESGTASLVHDFGAAVTATSSITGSTATISGAGVTGGRVVITENGTQVGTATVAGGTYTIPVSNVSIGNHTYIVTQTAPGNIVTAATTTAARADAITVTNPANPSAGYIPNTAFTFRGTAPKTAGTISIRNFTGLLIAKVPVDPTTGAWSWTRPNMGTSTWKLTFTTGEGIPNGESYTLPDFAPNATPALDLRVLNPANPSVGYTPNTAFTFSGVAKKTAGTLTIRNFTGLVIATVPVNPTTGAWSWTRSNMGTSIWKLTFATGEGTANQEKVTLGDFEPRP